MQQGEHYPSRILLKLRLSVSHFTRYITSDSSSWYSKLVWIFLGSGLAQDSCTSPWTLDVCCSQGSVSFRGRLHTSIYHTGRPKRCLGLEYRCLTSYWLSFIFLKLSKTRSPRVPFPRTCSSRLKAFMPWVRPVSSHRNASTGRSSRH